jgi:hypothetical protein
MPHDEGNPKDKGRREVKAAIRFSSFELRHYFGIRIFVIL